MEPPHAEMVYLRVPDAIGSGWGGGNEGRMLEDNNGERDMALVPCFVELPKASRWLA